MIDASQRGLQIFTGRAHPDLAQEIAKCLGVKLGQVSLGEFANGEICCTIEESVRGNRVFIIQSHTGSVNDAIMEQVLMIDAAKRASAYSITAVCPFFGYARQDRRASGREPIAARVVVDMLASAGADRIMSVDLHSGQIQGFFNGPFDHLIARPILLEYVKKQLAPVEDIVIVSPDAGRVKSAERYSSALGCSVAIVHKQRSYNKRNSSEAKYLIGDIKGKVCVIVDDMIDTAGTVCSAAELLAENGAKKIYCLATHGLFSDPAYKVIEKSAFDSVIVTSTAPINPPERVKSKIEVLPIAPLIAESIKAVHAGNSVSAIFDGQNQI